jgi:hypothetical protein
MDIYETIERDENLKRLTEISKANELVTEMQHEVDKYTKLLQLAKEDQVYTITHNVNYFQFLFRMKPAQDYFHVAKDTDKRSKEYKANKIKEYKANKIKEYKANKLMFESLEKYLEDEVFKKPVKIVDMYSGGYENYYYEIVFTIPDSDTKYTFTVPNIDVINVKNFEYAYDGKLAFGYYENEHCHHIKITSYCVEDITNAFEEFINKEHK